jgi:DNA-binding transcriptional regulator YdaS (Cro superfamily)
MKLSTYLSEYGISQRAFAKEIGESPQNIGRYVNGERIKIDPDTMMKIYKATKGQVTANDFYGLPNGKGTRQ